jgi:hypothetical protein
MASVARIREAAVALDAVAPDLTKNARQILLAQAMAESQFGDSFATPDGSRSYNWGAVYTQGDRGTIPVGDTQDGKPFKANAAWNSSDEVGARQFYQIVGRFGGALEAAAKGDLFGYAKALFRDNRMPYYGGFPPGNKNSLAPAGTPLHSDLDHYWRIIAYKRMTQGGAKKIAAALGEPFDMSTDEPEFTGAGASIGSLFTADDLWWLVGGTALAAGGLYAWKKGYVSRAMALLPRKVSS